MSAPDPHDTLRAAVLAFVAERGRVSRQDVATHLGIRLPAAENLLRELRRQGHLKSRTLWSAAHAGAGSDHP